MDARGYSIDEVLAITEQMIATPVPAGPVAPEAADRLLRMGEAILEAWLASKGREPTDRKTEGFRLLALHRQGAKGDPSFNACRETCREIVYHRNVLTADPTAPDAGRTLRLGAMVVRHLALFVGGKLETSGLGEFCCSSRPIRQAAAPEPDLAS